MSDVVIICVGNRYLAEDSLGSRVFDILSEEVQDIDVVDGGLSGINLLSLIEKRRRVVFVDAVTDIPKGDTGNEIVVLAQEQIASYACGYGHDAGLSYLLRMLPLVSDEPLPEIVLIGSDGRLNDSGVRRLAERCLEVARRGLA